MRQIAFSTMMGAFLLALIPSVGSASDRWIGEWRHKEAGYDMSATIRRGTRDPSFLVMELGVGVPNTCAGGVTVYGKPKGDRLVAESYDTSADAPPVCRLNVRMTPAGKISVEEDNDGCFSHHGASCDFNGEMARSR